MLRIPISSTGNLPRSTRRDLVTQLAALATAGVAGLESVASAEAQTLPVLRGLVRGMKTMRELSGIGGATGAYQIPKERVTDADGHPIDYDDRPMIEDQRYFRLWLSSLYLRDGGNWYTKYTPAVAMTASFQFGADKQSAQDQSFVYLTSTENVGKFTGTLADVGKHYLPVNTQVTPLVPYRGKPINIQAYLVADASNNVTPWLTAAGAISKYFAASVLSPYLAAATAILPIIDKLIETEKPNYKAGMQRGFSPAGTGGFELKPGYIVILDPTSGPPLQPESLIIRGEQLMYPRGGAPAGDIHAPSGLAPLTSTDYMVLRIESDPKFPQDIMDLPYVQTPFKNALDTLKKWASDKPNAAVYEKQAEAYIAEAKTAIAESADLIGPDKIPAANTIGNNYTAWKQTIVGA